MRKKFIALAMIVVYAFAVTSCGSIRTVAGPDLEKPVFIKQLVYTDEMDIELSYIQDYNWDKVVSKVAVVDGPKGVKCRVYDNDEYQEDEKYTLITVHVGIGSSQINDSGELPEDIKFSKVKITWDDGSETTEDVGNIVISSDDFDYDMIDESGDGDRGNRYVNLEPAEKDTELTGLKFRMEGAEKYFTDILFNETPLSEISVKHPLKLRAGESMNITVDINNHGDYGNVYIAADVMEKTKKGEAVYATVFLGWNIWDDGNIKDYLKTILE